MYRISLFIVLQMLTYFFFYVSFKHSKCQQLRWNQFLIFYGLVRLGFKGQSCFVFLAVFIADTCTGKIMITDPHTNTCSQSKYVIVEIVSIL